MFDHLSNWSVVGVLKIDKSPWLSGLLQATNKNTINKVFLIEVFIGALNLMIFKFNLSSFDI